MLSSLNSMVAKSEAFFSLAVCVEMVLRKVRLSQAARVREMKDRGANGKEKWT